MAKQPKQAYGFGVAGPTPEIPPTPVVAQRAPTAGDTGYEPATLWVDVPAADVYVLTSVAGGAANWSISSTGTTLLDTLTGDAGGAIPPDATHTINVVGGDTTTVNGAGNTITIDASAAGYPVTPYVVGAATTGGYTTVQAAINAANAAGGGTVFVQPGTYTENLTLYDGINIRGDGLQSIITGVHTPPASGAVIFEDLYLTSATDIITSAAAGTTRFRFESCVFNCTNGYVVDCASWTGPVDIYNCNTASTNDGVVNVATSTVAIEDSFVGAGTNALGIAGGTLAITNSRIPCPISPTGASAVSVTQGSFIGGTLTTAGTTALAVYDSTFSTGANAAVSHGSAGVTTLSNCTITSSANPCIAGAGAGVINITDVNFLSNQALAGTLTRGYVPETKVTKLAAGDGTYRVNVYTPEYDVIQAFASDDTASGAASLNAIDADMQVTAGDGNHTPDALQASIEAVSGANALGLYAVHGIAQQADGSVIASTLVGTEGEVTVSETDAADLPQVYCFGVKGYYNTDDAAAVPLAGEFAGVGSVVEYTSPLNAYGYGFVATRLDGGGAGTAARAAFGVAQGTSAIADWLYGLDLYNTATNAGQPYTNADIRMQNQSTIAVDTLGVSFSGDVAARSVNPVNTNIASFDVDVMVQSKANTGAAPTGANGDYNIIYMQDRTVMEEFVIAAGGQTIIAPRLNDNGLIISGDLANAEGYEYYFGHTTRSRHQFVIGTDDAFFIEAEIQVTDCGSEDPLWVGFRKLGAPNAVYTNYTDAATIGLRHTTNDDTCITGSNLNAGGWTYTNSTDAWTDGQSKLLRVNVSDAGVVTFTMDGVALSASETITFDTGDTVIPFIHHLFIAAGGTPSAVYLKSLKVGYQAWY